MRPITSTVAPTPTQDGPWTVTDGNHGQGFILRDGCLVALLQRGDTTFGLDVLHHGLAAACERHVRRMVALKRSNPHQPTGLVGELREDWQEAIAEAAGMPELAHLGRRFE